MKQLRAILMLILLCTGYKQANAQIYLEQPGTNVTTDSLLFDFSIFDKYEYDTVYHGDTMLMIARMPEENIDPVNSHPESHAETNPVVAAKQLVLFTDDNPDSLSRTVSDKPRLYYFTATWCAPCREVERTIFSNTEIAALLNENFQSIKVDIDSYDGFSLKQRWEIDAIPAFVFTNKSEIKGFNGLTDEFFFLKQLREMLPEH